MSRDFAFLFKPGDYLRDTQCLSEKTQVAYDRIMCEHMRNICISQAQLNFFTKRLSDDEKSELQLILSKDDNGFYIDWVRESIIQRKSYSESRRKNRRGGHKEDMINISETYVEHMENEDEIEDESINSNRRIKKFVKPTLEEVEKYFFENGYKPEIGKKAWMGYDTANWFDSKGQQIKNWKQKMINVWFRDEHKITKSEMVY